MISMVRDGHFERSRFEDSLFAATWIGHSTVLFRLAGKTFITDPILSKRIFLLPRLRPPALGMDELPPIDYILISHTHLDHLDLPTIRKLSAHSPGARLILPDGGRGYLGSIQFAEIHTLKVWESFNRDEVTISRVPSQHFGGRYGFDQLWKKTYGGYVVTAGEKSVYFAGDTGYSRDMFRKIGQHAAIDLALLPIGAYSPPPIRYQHMNPDDAVNAMLDLGAKTMLPIHHSTFILSAEPIKEPITRLRSLAASKPNLRILFPRYRELLEIP